MKITAGGTTYEFDMTSVMAKDVIALESALGVTFSRWSKEIVQRAKDGDVSMSDAVAMVFLARRQSGENTLTLDDVDFPFSSLTMENEDDNDTTDDESPPDRNADPTDGSPTTVSEPAGENSPPTV